MSSQLAIKPRQAASLDSWVAGSWGTAGTLWASRAGRVEFRWTGRRADGGAKSTKPPADPRRGESGGVTRAFPGQAVVGNETAGQPQLGVGRDDEPGPAVGLLGCAQRRGGPAERAFREPVRVLEIEASQVGPPADVEVGQAGSRPPQPEGLDGTGGGLGKVLDLDPDHAAAHDRRAVVAGPASAVPELRVQAVPGLHAHVAVARVIVNTNSAPRMTRR